jgi:hypothetical protein
MLHYNKVHMERSRWNVSIFEKLKEHEFGELLAETRILAYYPGP